jgi:HlyD family secretion protein
MKFPAICLSILLACTGLISCSDRSYTEALGSLERDRIILKATASEIVTSVLMSDGQDVKEGDSIIQLDDTRQKYQLAKAIANFASAEANLRKLHSGARNEDVAAASAQVVRAKSHLLEAQKTFERTVILVEKKLADVASLDKARSTRDSAAADVTQAHQQRLLLTNGTRIEDVQQAEADVVAAKNQLNIEQQRLDEMTIRATRSGKLDRLPKYLGERVNVGDTLAIILAGEAPYARVYIPESYRVKINAGQLLNVHVDGVKNSIQGKVRWVSQEPAFTPYYALNSADRARLVYLAEIQLPNDHKNLPSGVPVQVELPSN